jgi:hypothetical protein
MFKNPDLQKVYEETKHILDERLTKLDEISHDIKLLEEILKKSAIPKSVYLNIPEGNISWFNHRLCFENESMNRPLIETPSNIRIIVHPYFAEFLCKCMGGDK